MGDQTKLRGGQGLAENAVSGIEVREKRATGIFTHKERIYYLCAQGWKNAFDKEPEKYLSGEKLGRKGKK